MIVCIRLWLSVVAVFFVLPNDIAHRVRAQYSDSSCYNTECDLSPNSLSNALGVSVPQTCVDTDCGRRCFYTYIPECASEKSPLVYDMHGLNSCPLWNTFYTGWKEIADDKCAVVVWPKGNVRAGETSRPCWAIPGGLSGLEPAPNEVTMDCCCSNTIPVLDIPQAVEPEKKHDLAFLRSIASHVVRDVPLATNGTVTIDTKRIYMAGHSNGCIASFGMAMVHSDMVAAVCCHAGPLLTPPSEKYVPTPIWFVHGTVDKIVPYYGSNIQILLSNFFIPSQPAAFEYLRTLNGCSTVKNETIKDGFILTTSDCDDGANVEFMSLSDVGHFPFSHNISLSNTTYNTTLAAWEFCSSYESVQEPDLDSINEPPSLLTLLKSAAKKLI